MNSVNISGRPTLLSGFSWLKAALSACRAQPWPMAAIAIFYLCTMGLLSILPFVGSFLASLFMPFGTVLLGRACRDALNKRRPSFAILSDTWHDRLLRGVLIQQGLFFAVGLATMNLLFDFLASDTIARWVVEENGRLNWTSVSQNMPWTAIAATIAVYLPLLAATWFAPLLASEKRMSCGKSLFYSFFGCLRSLAAIIVLGVLLVAVVGTASVTLVLLIATLGLSGADMFLITPFAFAAATVLYAIYWPMYASLFADSGR